MTLRGSESPRLKKKIRLIGLQARQLERPFAGRSFFTYILTGMICEVSRLFSAANPITWLSIDWSMVEVRYFGS